MLLHLKTYFNEALRNFKLTFDVIQRMQTKSDSDPSVSSAHRKLQHLRHQSASDASDIWRDCRIAFLTDAFAILVHAPHTLVRSAVKLLAKKKKKRERKKEGKKSEPAREWEKEGGWRRRRREGEEWNVKIWITNASCTIWTEKTHIIAESPHIELDLLRDPSAPREINLVGWFD